MTSRFALILAPALLAAAPALAIQEVQLGPRAPSFAAGAAPMMGFDPLALPGITAPSSFGAPAFNSSGPELRRDPATWAFTGGETARVGGMFINTQSGPSWTMDRFAPLSFSPLSSFGRSPFDVGFTTRTTAGVMATESLMFYTSMGRTTYATIGSAAPVAPGLQLLEQANQRTDLRAGFKAELMPGVTFGMEAGFAQTGR
jgi:hypothetical protein